MSQNQQAKKKSKRENNNKCHKSQNIQVEVQIDADAATGTCTSAQVREEMGTYHLLMSYQHMRWYYNLECVVYIDMCAFIYPSLMSRMYAELVWHQVGNTWRVFQSF